MINILKVITENYQECVLVLDSIRYKQQDNNKTTSDDPKFICNNQYTNMY
jgi:hypothetical protein